MWNIEYKGKIKGDIEENSSGKPLPERSVMFKEPDSPNKAFALGALLAVPLMMLMLGPAVILGLIPYIVWYIIAPNLSFPSTLAMLLYSLAMMACAVGDYLNAYNCVCQVPKNGKVFNRGFHSYWIR